MKTSSLPLLVLLPAVVPLGLCSALVILESTAEMFLGYDEAASTGDMSLPEAFLFEEAASQQFFADLSDNVDEALGDGNRVLSVSVAVRGTTLHQDASSGKSRRTVNAVVTCDYLSGGYPADLDTALMYSVNASALPYPGVELNFRPYQPWQVLDTNNDNSMTAADKGLVAAVVALSVMLLAVSSVLLHVTGGWAACRQRVGNCLFEEIEEEGPYPPIDHKGTFRVDEDDGASTYGGGDVEQHAGYLGNGVMNYNNGMGGAMMDDQSVETGMTNPSGVLGVQHREGENPAAGLGIQSPDASRDGYAMSRYGNGLADTPVSASDRPLGIASMRDQQDDAAESKGLAHMIMERLNQYSGSKK